MANAGTPPRQVQSQLVTIKALIGLEGELDKATQAANRVMERQAKAAKKLADNFRMDNKALQSLNEKLANNKKEFENSTAGMQASSQAWQKFTSIISVVKTAFSALAGLMDTITGAFQKQQKAEVLTNAVIKATGGKAYRATEDLKKMAKALAAVTTFGDEEILGGMAQLSSFIKIGSEEFDTAIEAAMDLSILFKQDLKSSVMQLGKAFNDPISLLGALRRSGVSFTNEEAKMVKGLWAAGKTMEAQTELFRILKEQGVDKLARAMRDTLGGAIEASGHSFDNFMEAAGGMFDKIFSLQRGAEEAGSQFQRWADSIDNNSKAFMRNGIALDYWRTKVAQTMHATEAGSRSVGSFFSGIRLLKNPFEAAGETWDEKSGKNAERYMKKIEALRARIKALFEEEEKLAGAADKASDEQDDLNDSLSKTIGIATGFTSIAKIMQQAVLGDGSKLTGMAKMAAEGRAYGDMPSLSGGDKVGLDAKGEGYTGAGSSGGKVVSKLDEQLAEARENGKYLYKIEHALRRNRAIFVQ